MNNELRRRGGLISRISADWKRVGRRFFLYAIYPNQFSYVLWFRVFPFFYNHPFPFIIIRPLVKFIHELFSQWLGIQIPLSTRIGKGFSIKHYSGIVINGSATLGECCTIFQNVTIGRSFEGDKKGVPIIGDNVILFPGAKVIGGIIIGNNVIIGANAVVISDIPSNSVVAGVPAKVISNRVESYFSDKYFTYITKKS